MAFQYGVASVPDINFDGIDDVVTGDQNGTYYCISGKGDSLLFSHTFPGDRINTVNVMPSIDGNYSYELLAGTKNGKVVCFSGGVDTVSTNVILTESVPDGFQLFQNYPNPFNPSTVISWQSAVGSWQTLKIYDVLGNEIVTLVDEYRPAGKYEVEFNSASSIRYPASGVYFYQLKAGKFVATKKMLLLK